MHMCTTPIRLHIPPFVYVLAASVGSVIHQGSGELHTSKVGSHTECVVLSIQLGDVGVAGGERGHIFGEFSLEDGGLYYYCETD